MPSWNIHTAHVERLLAEEPAAELGVRDPNVFLFGNYVPDVYVGYLVPDVDHTLRYCDTHVTEPHAIPIPGEGEFWRDYIAPYIAEGGVDDLTLGVWAHLMADNRYNTLVRAYNAEHGIPAGDETRIRKQSDFDRFGKALDPKLRVELTPALVEAAANFGPYEVAEDDVAKAVEASRRLLDPSNPPAVSKADDAETVGPAPSAGDGYLLLDQTFLDGAFAETDRAIREGLHRYVRELRAAGGDPTAAAPRRAPKRGHLPVGPPPAVLLAKDRQAAAYDAPLDVSADGTRFEAGRGDLAT